MQRFFEKIFTKKAIVVLALLLFFAVLQLLSFKPGVAEFVDSDSLVCCENCIAITFDDGPQYKTTMELLDGLKERDVVATFFLLGEKIEERKEVVERMQQDGHLIGNHTYSHIQLTSVSLDTAIMEVNKTNELIKSITGEIPTYIRPPFGSWSTKLEEEINMTPVLWTVDPCDWNTDDVGKVVECVVNEVESGDIVLMHDIYASSVTAALEIVDRLKAKGYVFVTVDQLILD